MRLSFQISFPFKLLLFFFFKSDVNECASNPCGQVCENMKGSYECRCADGFLDTSPNEHGRDCLSEGNISLRDLLCSVILLSHILELAC